MVQSIENLLAWARQHADKLEQDMTWLASGRGDGGYWRADPDQKFMIAARATAALEFLRRYAGSDSEWALRAQMVYANKGDSQSSESGARALGDILREWAEQAEVGVIDVPGAQAAETRQVASTDLMEQVRQLIAAKGVHPSAPIVLAGAALEIALRLAVEERRLKLDERPSMTAYARRLRSEGLIAKQDMKNIEQMAGLRNDAAHGQFELLSAERAGLMEQQVNYFLARLSRLLHD